MDTLNTIALILLQCIGIYCAAHALLNKRNAGAAFSWIIVNLFLIVLGPTLYYLFGINRLQRKAYQIRPDQDHKLESLTCFETGSVCLNTNIAKQFLSLVKLSDALTGLPLLLGNHIQLLKNGEEAYPDMLEAIRQAKSFIYLSTYIFDTDSSGRAFIDALVEAHQRGVTVRVLIDSYGEAFQIPRASTLLKRKGVATACFLPIFPIPRINLRNHKKILVIDSGIAYTGGMNISARHLVDNDNPNRVIDAHFKLTGPVVKQIEYEFIVDWYYVSNETLNLSQHTSLPHDSGTVCRALSDGPDNDVDLFIETLISAFAAAQNSITIMTPYFIPTPEISASLKAAAKRGVAVTLLLSEKTDLPYINWASNHILAEFIKSGVCIYYQPPPFVHAKLVLVDKYYTQIGSVNMDPRSLKLNFEFAVEAYDASLGRQIQRYINTALKKSVAKTLTEINNRSMPIRIRDAFAWLFSPYL